MTGKRRFWGEMWAKDGRTVTRGSSTSLTAHIRGWDIGVEIVVFVNEDGEDEIVVRPTGGSNKPIPGEIVYATNDGSGETPLSETPLISPMQEIRIRIPKKRKVQLNQNN